MIKVIDFSGQELFRMERLLFQEDTPWNASRKKRL